MAKLKKTFRKFFFFWETSDLFFQDKHFRVYEFKEGLFKRLFG